MSLHTTIMIAAYNAERFLPKSIASARAQRGITPDIIVVDDASQDNTSQIVREIPDVRYFKLPQNGGPSAARNIAIEEARGNWIAVLDADDEMQPERLSRMIAYGKAAQADIVLGNFMPVGSDGSPLNGEAFLDPESIDPQKSLSLEDYIAGNQMTAGEKSLGYLKPLFRRKYLIENNLRYDLTLRNSEDYHIIAAAIAEGAKVIISPDPDYLYRQVEGSLSATLPPDYIKALLAADAALASKVLPTASEELARQIESRRYYLEMLLAAETTMCHLKKRQFLTALKNMIKTPKACRLVAEKLAEATRKRTLSR